MSVSQVPRRAAVSRRSTLLSPIVGGQCVRLPRRRHAGAPIFVDCCRAGIAELPAAGGDAGTIEQTIVAHPLDGDEQGALRRWALRRQAAAPAPDLDAAGCEAAERRGGAMTAVGPLVAHDDVERGKRVDRSAGAHRPPVREGEGRESAAARDVSGRRRDQAALADSDRVRTHAPVDAEVGVQPC